MKFLNALPEPLLSVIIRPGSIEFLFTEYINSLYPTIYSDWFILRTSLMDVTLHLVDGFIIVVYSTPAAVPILPIMS